MKAKEVLNLTILGESVEFVASGRGKNRRFDADWRGARISIWPDHGRWGGRLCTRDAYVSSCANSLSAQEELDALMGHKLRSAIGGLSNLLPKEDAPKCGTCGGEGGIDVPGTDHYRRCPDCAKEPDHE